MVYYLWLVLVIGICGWC